MEREGAARMGSRIERVHVSWTQQQDVDAYIDDYLRRRRHPAHARAAVTKCIARYIGNPPITRADLDFFLDANLRALVP
jgi:hypothetical protein